MKKELNYDVELLEITVNLDTNGWGIIANKIMCCKKKRMNLVWFESQYSTKRIYAHHLDNPGYSNINQNCLTYQYSQIVRPEDKDKSIIFLTSKIHVDVSGRAKMLTKMAELAKNTPDLS